jgi:hypothetical protein
MDTTVTGMFPSHRVAGLAAARLMASGFRSDQIRVVDAHSRDRHRMIDETTSGAARGVTLGGLFGAIGGSLAGVMMESFLAMGHATIVGALVGTIGGTVLGLVIGRSTKSQVQDEMEHQVEAGAVLVNVVTDEARTAIALQLLAEAGGTSVVSTAASFTAAGVPNTPEA